MSDNQTPASMKQSLILFYEKDIADLERRFGDGARPSWVSTDLAIAKDKLRRLKES